MLFISDPIRIKFLKIVVSIVIQIDINSRSEFLNTIARSNLPKENLPKQPHANCQLFRYPSKAINKNNEQTTKTRGLINLGLISNINNNPNKISIEAIEYTRIIVVE